MSSDAFQTTVLRTIIDPATRCSHLGETPLASPVRLSHPSGIVGADTQRNGDVSRRAGHIRMLRLPQVRAITGLGKTKIYELQAEGTFPMRVKLTAQSVAWVEADVQAWLAACIEANVPLVET